MFSVTERFGRPFSKRVSENWMPNMIFINFMFSTNKNKIESEMISTVLPFIFFSYISHSDIITLENVPFKQTNHVLSKVAL